MNKNNFRNKKNTELALVKLWVLLHDGCRWNENTPVHKKSIIIYGYRTKSRNDAIERLKHQFRIRQEKISRAIIYDNQTGETIEILK